MQLKYNGKDITSNVQIAAAKCRDVSAGRSDSLEIVTENAAAWYAWQPQTDDRLEIIQDGYSTGEMYVAAVAPEGKRFRILATAAKSEARRKKSGSYAGITLERLMQLLQRKAKWNTAFMVFRRTRYTDICRGTTKAAPPC